MRIWFDTEFTSLEEPDLLSVGLVAEDGSECYVELIDAELERRCSDFVLETVLPQFGLRGCLVSKYAELAERVGEFLAAVAPAGSIELIFDYKVDRELLQHALERAPQWSVLVGRTVWTNVAVEVDSSEAAQAAIETVFQEARAEGLDRHHALVDARALRQGHLAAVF